MTDKVAVASPSAPPGGPYSPGLVVGEWVFLAGQVGAGSTIEEQARDALSKVDALLAAAGAAPADVVSCLVHLADLADFERFNAVYERHFAEPRPVRTTVGAALLDGALVEITATGRRLTAE
ncbi:MAG TPA: Rid family hydrolase [Streptosporangiaceae bacterium]|jgi:2-iminobutanoate/2-iminopropanoate deaminase